jgi:DNA gyrase/topoisomerase IV subunit B
LSDSEIEKLTDWQHARIRTEMFLSSRDAHTQSVLEYRSTAPITVETTWVPSLAVAFREVLDNALDEVVAHGYGDRIDVSYDPVSMIFSVKDNGRGIPITFDEKYGLHKATLALTHTKAGRNFGERGETRGLNGVGASIVNFCSEYFDVSILRDKKEFTQRFSEGDGTNTDLVIEDPLIMPSDSKKTGTTITFKPSKHVFHDMRLPADFIAARMIEVALCYPALKVFYNGTRIPSKPVEQALFPQHKPITFTVDDGEDFKSRFWLVPQFLTDGTDYAHSLVNAIPMFNGGVHIDQFRRSFFSGLLTALEKESKKRKLLPNRSDISDGLLIFNITQMKAPNFDSQSKSRLINENVTTIVRKTMDDPAFFISVIKRYPEWIEAIFAKCAERTQKKDDADLGKVAKKSKREKVADLQDACGNDRSKCIIFLTEGKCLRDDTEIKVMENGELISKALRDVGIGDLVLTHKGNIRPVTNRWTTTKPSVVINTHYGKIIGSAEHRLLVWDKIDNNIDWISLENIDQNRHQLSRYLMAHMMSMVDILQISQGEIENMVDISVEEDESFVLSSGIISHNSAVAGLTDARDPDIHGGLPLRGKPMNVREKLLREVMENGSLTDVMKSIGLFPNQRVNRHLLRYGKVFLTTDADEDGKNIAALLINFFHHFWPELFDPEKPPFIYIFDTPLIIAVKGKQRKFWYKDDYDSFDSDKYKGWEITRAKGLAALKKADWQYVLANPKVTPIIDDGKLSEALSLLFNKTRADDRKTFIGL